MVMWRVIVVVGLLAGATAFGLWWRSRNGRVVPSVPASASQPATPRLVGPERLGFDPADARVTLVQFSSAFCQPCRATRVILRDVAASLPGVRHVEVDAESHLDLVRELDIRRTPTVLFVDPAGSVVRRASGQPRRADVVAAVAPFLAAAP
jgi:thiol-disulfide isomerase/thioredoxin